MPGKLTLITVNDIVETPTQKQALNERTGAEIVDMETFAVADVCRIRNVPFFSYRVVLDTVEDQIPKDIAKILDTMDKGVSRLTGAVLGNIWHRPSVVLDFVSLRKRAFTATERLAQFAIVELSRKKDEKFDLLEKTDSPHATPAGQYISYKTDPEATNAPE
jgi:adenosylhomocysteine nucleosidase